MTTYVVQIYDKKRGWRDTKTFHDPDESFDFADNLIAAAEPGHYDHHLRVIERVLTERTILTVRETYHNKRG